MHWIKSIDPYSTDPGVWGDCINQQVRSYWAIFGPKTCQNTDCGFSASKRQSKHQKRFLSKVNFKQQLVNGECVTREWLCYSPSQGNVFCFACKLFGPNQKSAFVTGFCDLKHTGKLLEVHEKSVLYRQAMVEYIRQSSECGTVDSELRKTVQCRVLVLEGYFTELLL